MNAWGLQGTDTPTHHRETPTHNRPSHKPSVSRHHKPSTPTSGGHHKPAGHKGGTKQQPRHKQHKSAPLGPERTLVNIGGNGWLDIPEPMRGTLPAKTYGGH